MVETITLPELLARWDSPDGHPYKGELINLESAKADPSNPGCMCAQGQVLHYIGGLTFAVLAGMSQTRADKRTGEVLGISTAHAILLRKVNDRRGGAPAIVLTHPEKLLGDQAHVVLAFWRHLDRMTEEQWRAAREATGEAGWGASCATAEIQGAAVMRELGMSFGFLPAFGFADPEAVLAADHAAAGDPAP